MPPGAYYYPNSFAPVTYATLPRPVPTVSTAPEVEESLQPVIDVPEKDVKLKVEVVEEITVSSPKTPRHKKQKQDIFETTVKATEEPFTNHSDDFLGSPSFFFDFKSPNFTERKKTPLALPSSGKRRRDIDPADTSTLYVNLFPDKQDHSDQVDAFLSTLNYD